MRFHLGDIPESADFIPDASWRPLPQTSVGRFQLIALPVAVVAAAVFAALWVEVTPLGWGLWAMFPLPIVGFGACLVGVLVVHELLHVVVHPLAGRSRRSAIGFWPSRMFLYAHYDGELTRNRCLFILLTPFVVISVLPLIAASILGQANGWVAYITILNAFLASGDLVAAADTLFRFPANVVFRGTGWRAYVKENAEGVDAI